MEQINNVAIVVAMEKELNLLLPLVNEPKELVIDGYRLYSGTINGTGAGERCDRADLTVFLLQSGLYADRARAV